MSLVEALEVAPPGLLCRSKYRPSTPRGVASDAAAIDAASRIATSKSAVDWLIVIGAPCSTAAH